MAQIKPLFDEYGVIYQAMKDLSDELKINFLEALAELEDSECHRTRKFPKTRLEKGLESVLFLNIFSQMV